MGASRGRRWDKRPEVYSSLAAGVFNKLLEAKTRNDYSVKALELGADIVRVTAFARAAVGGIPHLVFALSTVVGSQLITRGTRPQTSKPL